MFQVRNKLNEQQNTKLAANRDLLTKRKDEVSKMDNRIHELQQRLKKKRAQQAQISERNKNQINQQNNRLSIRHGGPANVVAVEPYIQQTSNDREDINKPGFGKQDPKYQSLPPNSKFSVADNKDSLKMRETNNNTVDHSRKRLEPDKTEEYSIPLVVSVDPSGGKSVTQNGVPSPKPSPTNRTPPPYPASSQSTSALPSYSGGQATLYPPSSNQVTQVSQRPATTSSQSGRPPPPPIPARSGISHWTARPFGSTYSTSMLPNRVVGGVQAPSQPRVEVHQEEQRVGGSGQSSPASSDSSHRDNTINGGHRGNTGSLKPGYHGNSPQNLSPNSNSDNTRTKDNSQLYDRMNDRTSSQPSVPTSKSQTPVNKSDSEDETISVSKGINKFSGLIAQSQSKNSKGSQDKPSGATVSGGFSNLNHTSVVGHKPMPTYRYAPKSVIATTYFGHKMGSEALEKYQKNVLSLHRNLNATDKQDSVSEEVGKTGKINENLSGNVGQGDDSGSNLSSPLSTGSASSPASTSPLVQQPYPFDFPGSPPHADVASDKVSYKPNTPKNIRRRHSDSDNEEVGRALQKYEISSGGHVPLPTLPSQENQMLTIQNNDGQNIEVEIQATSFSDTIPETVLLDNRGNIVEVNNTSPSNSRESLDSDDISKSSPKSIDVVITNNGVKLPKKTNLKSANSKKSGNRVTFDPLALLLDSSLEGELELVKKCAVQVSVSFHFYYTSTLLC